MLCIGECAIKASAESQFSVSTLSVHSATSASLLCEDPILKNKAGQLWILTWLNVSTIEHYKQVSQYDISLVFKVGLNM